MHTYLLDFDTATGAPVTCTLHRRLPATVLVGLSAAVARECAERVRAAVLGSGFDWPRQRVELQVGDGLSGGSTYVELALAVSVLVASGQLPAARVEGLSFYAELSLSGEVRAVRGTVAAAEAAQRDGKRLVVARGAGADAAAHHGLPVVSVGSLRELVDGALTPHLPATPTYAASPLDLADIQGQDPLLPDTLTRAARARTPLYLVGPPGCGKTMLAARLPSILPILTEEEARGIARRFDAVGLAPVGPVRQRPFRAPHHSISLSGLLGHTPVTAAGRGRIGEVGLAEEGVLFLDEVAEFPRATLQALGHALREPGRRVWLVVAGDGEGPREEREQKALQALGFGKDAFVRVPMQRVSHRSDRLTAWPSSERVRQRVEAAL
jgi:magnesium chelatase family protein